MIETIQQLRFEDVSFSYAQAQHAVIENLTMDLPLDKNIWITGTAGHGQSTFIKLLAVLLQPNQGRYLINGHDTTQMSFEEFLPFRLKIGYTFDFGGLFANRTLYDNFMLPLTYHKISEDDEAHARILELSERFHFPEQLRNRPAQVSGGLRKLACALRAVLMNPEMLVMDDPFTALDPETAKSFIALLEESRAKRGLKHVFLTSRDSAWPEKMGCERLLMERNKEVSQNQKRSVA